MEPKNIRVHFFVTPSIWKKLAEQENYSEYLRRLVESDLRKKHDKKLSV